ncbi:MAG: tRNA lysidine(34) synthetase TilS [Bacteroidetes bacterium]|nr:tRNA lysidine(34) synthetase TilS [Bacteroidota bacterium]
MFKAFLDYITLEKLFKSGDRILLAVSGGMDSVAMTTLFQRAGFSFGIAHCNFGLRGADSDADLLFVQAMAERLHVTFFSKKMDTLAYASDKGLSIQMAARELRYEWFEELLATYDYQYLATAHHADDQIETLFINLIRGTGITGLHGILPKHDKIIHPMLFTFREDIEKFIIENDLAYRTDNSNLSLKYLRNQIRLQLIPILRSIEPDYQRIITESIYRIREAESIYHEHVKARLDGIIQTDKSVTKILIENVKSLKSQKSYIFEMLSPYGFNYPTVERIISALDEIPGKQFISKSHRLLKDREYLIIYRKDLTDKDVPDNILIDNDILFLDDPLRLKFSVIEEWKNNIVTDQPSVACLDYDELTFPLELRKWKKGDYFYPFGSKGRKKISDFFIDEKMSLYEKENTWLFISGEAIIWVIGKRIDNRYCITAKTRKIFQIKLFTD